MIEFKNVRKAYTGKIGCMCGCKGKYSIPTHVSLNEANAECGYKAYDKHSNRSVKYVVGVLNRSIPWGTDEEKKYVSADNATIDIGNRSYTVWF